MQRPFGFLKTTALGGLLFLLPLIVIGALVGQAVPIVVALAGVLGKFIPVQSALGGTLLTLLAVAFVLLLCFVAGLIARLSLGRRFSGWVERNLLLLVPRYAIVRDQMAGKVGSAIVATSLKPVLVAFDDHYALAFETDRSEQHVAIFLPGAPDVWSGQFIMVAPQRVTPLNIEFSRATDMCKRLGRDSVATVAAAHSG